MSKINLESMRSRMDQIKYEDLREDIQTLWEEKKYAEALRWLQTNLAPDNFNHALIENNYADFSHIVTYLLNSSTKYKDIDKINEIMEQIEYLNNRLLNNGIAVFDVSNGYIHANEINKQGLFRILDEA